MTKSPGVEIKTFVVTNARGQIVGVRLTRGSALSLFLSLSKQDRGGIQPHTAHKRMHPQTQQGSDKNHAPDEYDRRHRLRSQSGA